MAIPWNVFNARRCRSLDTMTWALPSDGTFQDAVIVIVFRNRSDDSRGQDKFGNLDQQLELGDDLSVLPAGLPPEYAPEFRDDRRRHEQGVPPADRLLPNPEWQTAWVSEGGEIDVRVQDSSKSGGAACGAHERRRSRPSV